MGRMQGQSVARRTRNSIWHDMHGSRQNSASAEKKNPIQPHKYYRTAITAQSEGQRRFKGRRRTGEKGVGNQQQQASHCKNGL